MTLLSWREDYRVGVEAIDAEHRYLFDLINDFHDRHLRGDTRGAVLAVLNRLVAYAEEHFQHEERLMRANDYPKVDYHLGEHERLFESVFGLNDKLARGTANIDAETMRFLKTWLVDHIVMDDMELADFLQRKAARRERAAADADSGTPPAAA